MQTNGASSARVLIAGSVGEPQILALKRAFETFGSKADFSNDPSELPGRTHLLFVHSYGCKEKMLEEARRLQPAPKIGLISLGGVEPAETATKGGGISLVVVRTHHDHAKLSVCRSCRSLVAEDISKSAFAIARAMVGQMW